MNYKFQPNRGGHAPGHLRDAFVYAVESIGWGSLGDWYTHLDEDSIVLYNPEKQTWWESLSPRERGFWLLGQLWNCTDIMPSVLCDTLDIRSGDGTYAQGARKLKTEMRE
jgi:hypothetical protein